MVSEPDILELPRLTNRVYSALRATADAAVCDPPEILDELTAAVEDLGNTVDTIAERDRDLALERRRYRELFDEAPDAYLAVDAEGVILDANATASRMLRVPVGRLVGKPFAAYLAPRAAPGLHVRLSAGIDPEGDPTDWLTWVRPRAARQFPAWVRLRAMGDADGRPVGARLLVRDISERVRAENRERAERALEGDRLRGHARRLEALERSKSDFLGLISHELRAPLGLVRGYLTMMADGSMGDVGERARGVLPIALQKCDEISSLVDQAVRTVALEEGVNNLALTRADLRDLASRAIAAAAPVAEMGRRRLRLVGGESAVPVTVDAGRILTILRNLLDNAVKYSIEGSEVRCEVGSAGGMASVSVTDRGPGIPATQMERLFTRFGRVVSDQTQRIGGTGLGLYLSRELARLHGGDIVAASRQGVGSTFVLTLPLARR